MVASLWLSWQDQVSLSSSDGRTVVAGPAARIVWQPLAAEIVAALQRLAPPGEDEERLAESILAAGTVDSLARWYYHVDQLGQRGLIRRSLHADGRLLATLSPFGRAAPETSRASSGSPSRQKNCEEGKHGVRPAGDTSPFVLSRFAYIRREGGDMVLESPLAHARVILHDPALLSFLAELAAPKTMATLMRQHQLAPGLAAGTTKAFLALLREARMLEQIAVEGGGSTRADDAKSEGTLESWEFHDLLFHSRSRMGRSDRQFGGTYRLAHRAPAPALKAVAETEVYELFQPDLARLERDDPPLAQVQERRRSLRQYGADPITSRQLGEFLFRIARVKEQGQSHLPASTGQPSMEVTLRPYPAGGGLYELEFYVAVKACQGLAPGLYHYDPLGHRLERQAEANRAVESLLQDAAASAGIPADNLQVLIVLTSRFDRIAWKYESIAYSLTLKHVGVVYQTMYLAATAMNLAPCAIGCGDADLFARAAGTDYYVESSVGEFLLGSRVSEVLT